MNKKVLAGFVVLLVSAIAGWGVVFSMGSIPDADGTIHGCYQNHKNDNQVQGQLRVVSDAANCKENETPLSWNQEGQQGPPGPAGVLSFYTVSDTVVAQGVGDLEDLMLEVLCDSGDVVVGGVVCDGVQGLAFTPKEEGEIINQVHNEFEGEEAQNIGTELLMYFTKTESIDVVIYQLKKVKEAMLDEQPKEAVQV